MDGIGLILWESPIWRIRAALGISWVAHHGSRDLLYL